MKRFNYFLIELSIRVFLFRISFLASPFKYLKSEG
jgi:hypothetical protein